MARSAQQGSTSQTSPAENSVRQRWVEAGLIIAFWTCIFLFNVAEHVYDPRHSEGIASDRLWHMGFENFLWLFVTPVVFWLVRRFSLERRNWPRHVAFHVAFAFGAAIAVESLSHIVFPIFDRSYSLSRSLARLHFINELVIYFIILMAGFARDYFLRYQERQREATSLKMQTSRMQAQLAEARLQALRMQINPHFLFNTLHAVSTLVDQDPRGVQRMIARLSEMLRYALDNTSTQEVPLSEELKFLDDYLEIQRIRFQGRLETEVRVEPALREVLVPSLILQPIVENAIKHGASQAEGMGRVTVSAHRDDGNLVLAVRDNGPGLESFPKNGDASSSGIGLKNTRERLESLYGDAHRLELTQAEGGGLLVQIVLPYHTSSDLRTSALLPETQV